MKQAKYIPNRWSRRYFELREGRVSYFKAKGELQERGSFAITRHCEIDQACEPVTVVSHRKMSKKTMYSVKIRYHRLETGEESKRSYAHNSHYVLLAAETRAEAEEWSASLGEAIKRDVELDEKPPSVSL